MKNKTFFLITAILFFSCQKTNMQSVNAEEKIGIESNEGASLHSGLQDKSPNPCWDAYWKSWTTWFQGSAGDPYRTLHDCVMASITWSPFINKAKAPVNAKPLTLCQRYPFLCQSKITHPEGQFPNLLAVLDLNLSSSRDDIGQVHDFLQKFNNLILGAVSANPDWLNLFNTDKRYRILSYYHDVYLASGNSLSTDEFNFLVIYIDLLFYEGNPKVGDIMQIPPGWVYMLFYNTNQPLVYPDQNGILPGGGDLVWDTPNFLDIVGVPIGFFPIMVTQ